MIEINPNCLYTRPDLAAMLEPAGVDVDTFLARLRPRKIFRMLFLGRDLLTALENAPDLRDSADETPTPMREPRRMSGTHRPNKPSKKGLIGGHFSPESLGISTK